MHIFSPYEIVNKERLSNIKGKIIASNHVSNFDPPFIGSVIPYEIYFMAKAELFKNKLFGNLLNKLNVIPIKRGKMDIGAIKKCINVLNQNHSLLIFPQGTRNGKNAKAGIGMIASAVKKDIVPIYVENSNSLLSCFFRIKKVRIIIGETIEWSEYAYLEGNKEKYQLISNDIFNKINQLSEYHTKQLDEAINM
jgi:1-acyl-sn-glycerol-3-phosphate acyltransferase